MSEMKEFDLAFLRQHAPSDQAVRIAVGNGEVAMEVDVPGSGTVALRFGVDDILKLAARMYTAGRAAQCKLADQPRLH